MFRTSNPVMSENLWERCREIEQPSARTMTVQGAINKSFILLAIVLIPAIYTWAEFFRSGKQFESIQGLFFLGLGGGLVLCLLTCFMVKWAAITAPLYAACEGFFLGGLSAFVESRYPGIVLQAVGLTLAIFAGMLLLYTSRTIRATPKFVAGVMIATAGVFILYLVSWLFRAFGGSAFPFIHEATGIGIGFSIFVVILAALNLVLDFDLIERGAQQGAPKYMEWFGAFGLLVTLVWLYIEVLRLLIKLRSRD